MSHWGKGFPHPCPLEWGQKRPLKPLLFDFPHLRKTIDYCFGRNCPHRDISCRSLFFIVVGTMTGIILIGSETLRVFSGVPFLRRKSSPSLTNCNLNRGVGKKGEFLCSWRLESPRCGWRRVILASRLSRPVLPKVYSSLWSIWATDLLRQAKALCWITILLFIISK